MRLHLTCALIVTILLVVTLRAHNKPRFTFAQVQALAEKRAAAPYVPLPDTLPPQLNMLSPVQDQGINWKDTYRLWRKKGLPFQVDFYHRLNSNPVPFISPQINTVDAKGSHPLAYSPTFFTFLDFSVKPPVPLVFHPPLPNDLGYAGFYVRYPDMGIDSNANSLDGFFSVLGGSYFRVIAKDQVYGLSARGLAIDTEVDGKKEEFPAFCEWWLQEPAPDATALVLDALLDSPSVTGAYEFTVRPGAVTTVDVHASLIFRKNVERLGIAPFSSMYDYGENAKDHFGDTVHPEIHDSDGVLMRTGHGEWLWRPLQQRPDHQIYNLMDENPKGFGLVQRDRDFQHYQDLHMKYNVRPSVWVTPHGDWGKGAVQLIQLPTNSANTDNVVLFWHPDQPVKAGDRMDLSYTIDFYMNDAQRPPLAYTKATFVISPAPPPNAPGPSSPVPVPVKPVSTSAKSAPASVKPAPAAPPVHPVPPGVTTAEFQIDFAGNGIENIPANQPPQVDVNCLPAGAVIRDKPTVEKNTYDNSWRVTFTVIPVKIHVPTEIQCRLMSNGKPLTETWNYTWHQ